MPISPSNMTTTMPTSVPLYHTSYGLHPQNGINGFVGFRKRCERVDWRKLASIDLDFISQTMDFTALQENLMNITFCSIESELDVRQVDPNFIKLFKLSQLIIEYLLNSQEYLANVVLDLEEKLKKVTELHDTNEIQLKDKLNELNTVKKESHKRKKLLTAQQQLITTASVSSNKCPYCPKSFITSGFLQSHIEKRHPDSDYKSGPSTSPPSLTATLQRELAEIKERLRLTETHLHSDHSKPRSRAGSPVKWVEEEREAIIITSPRLIEGSHGELDQMRDVYMRELRELGAKYESSQTALHKLQGQHSTKTSNLGTLRDDVDVEDMMSQQKEEMALVTKNLQLQMQDVKVAMQDKLVKQDRRWQRRLQAMTVKHGEEISKMTDELSYASKKLVERKQMHATELRKQEEQFQKIKQNPERAVIQEQLQSQRSKSLKAVSEPQMTYKSARVSNADDNVSAFLMDDDSDSDLEEALKATAPSTLRSSSEPDIRKGGKSISELKKDPKILRGMREEVQSLLDAKLDSIGVPSHSRALGSKLLEIKLASLRNERKAKEQRFMEFNELRQKIQRNIANTAKEKLKSLKRSPSSPRNRGNNAISPPNQSPAKTQTLYQSPARISQGQAESPRRPPRPAPRTSPLTPQPKAVRRSLQSTGSTTEWTSSQWDSDDDDDSDDASVNEDDNNNDIRQRKSGVVNLSTPVKQAPPVRARSPPKIMVPDNDWDDVSELEEVMPTAADRPRVPTPKGVNVSQRSREIEFQLAGRSSTKPVGGVDTMKSTVSATSHTTTRNSGKDDDDFSDISLLDDDLYATPLKKPTGSRQSYGESENSTNTYNTSKWGSSKAPSTVAGSHNVTNNDDWDDSDVSVM